MDEDASISGVIRAVLWDFGGVITTSPFESFARYERSTGLPEGFIRSLNATNHERNAWARLERSEVGIEEFCRLYEEEARAAGHALDARAVLACLAGEIRPEMVRALRAIRERGLKQACLTNNFVGMTSDRPPEARQAPVFDLFDAVVESSKIGVRKPEPRFYLIACELLGISPPEAVMLDDIGINLKPARELGMRTIKVVDAGEALRELEEVLGFPLA
jgi:putative hydrolase of the HAD superfamily